ncbi:hypothetical protein EIP91_009714 [Steccherinum ochraceum]|uniref:Uncharacterized protein n=1 Tax=Steccherinum ochraceum TaxID=92696 RepID=A0A4R0R1C6_9APHY|nr:hypothetical protein EIP91_009714 [Steccherinum ochraceum]
MHLAVRDSITFGVGCIHLTPLILGCCKDKLLSLCVPEVACHLAGMPPLLTLFPHLRTLFLTPSPVERPSELLPRLTASLAKLPSSLVHLQLGVDARYYLPSSAHGDLFTLTDLPAWSAADSTLADHPRLVALHVVVFNLPVGVGHLPPAFKDSACTLPHRPCPPRLLHDPLVHLHSSFHAFLPHTSSRLPITVSDAC